MAEVRNFLNDSMAKKWGAFLSTVLPDLHFSDTAFESALSPHSLLLRKTHFCLEFRQIYYAFKEGGSQRMQIYRSGR